jgi:hypothetical protein
MKKTQVSLLGIIVASFCLCKNASAVLPIPVYSGMFDFTTGQLGTVGTGEGWANNSTSITVTNGSGSLDGTSLGLQASTGDKVYITAAATAGVGSDNVFANKSTYPQSSNVDIYISFLYKFDSIAGIGNSVKICQENLQNSGSTVFWDLQAMTNNSGQIQLGIEKAPGSGTVVFATTNINVGDTVFVVVRHQILSGTTDDIIDLWINPPPASFGADEASVPPPSATTSDGTEPSSGTGPGRFYLDVGVTNAEFDELRIATNWAIVTPAYGSCVSAGIYQDPVSQTNVAEIADQFTVIPSPTSTSPTYQWQFSPSGSSTFTNISGAIFASYTTPNLALATDNGNQYRCIVTAPCDNSSTTSAVATATLTAPIVTPVGLVLDDTFTAGIAEPITPVTISNASWYTDLADHSSAFNVFPDQYLQATPVSGSSTLWLAYITPTNNPPTNDLPNLPVDLAVGNTIKATCQFTPVSFNSFTNNASFRIGLFDYADGGTRIVTADSTAGGSTGNGVNVRGYMLSVDFGTNFVTSSPLSMYSRVNLGDINLMGTTADYLSLGGGPSGGGYSNAPAFQAEANYTLVFSVTRNDVNSVIITNSITRGGTNWAFTLTETNQAYHRFDALAMRPNSLETSADSFNISELKVEVLAGPSAPTSIVITNVSHTGNNVILGWSPTPAGTYSYSVLSKTNLTDAAWVTNQTGISTTSYTNTSAAANTGFYRVTSP